MAIPQPDGPITVLSDTTTKIGVIGNDDFTSDETPLTVHLTGPRDGVVEEGDHFIFDPRATGLDFAKNPSFRLRIRSPMARAKTPAPRPASNSTW